VRGTPGALAAVRDNPALRRVQLAFLASTVGSWAYATVIIVWAYEAGGVAAVSLWMGARFALGAVVTPVGALYADRWPRRRLLILGDGARAVMVALTAVLVALDLAELLVFVLATLATLLVTPYMVALRAWLPQLARTPLELTATNGVQSTIESVARFAGPAVAGFLVAASGVAAVLAALVVAFAVSLVLVARVRPSPSARQGPRREDVASEAPGFLLELVAGFGALGRDRWLLLATVLVSLQALVSGASTVFLVVMAADVLGSPDTGLGVLNAALGVGSVLGGLLAIGRAGRGTLARDMTVGVVLWSAPLLLVTGWPTAALCVAAVGVLGLANPVVDVNVDTVMQRVSPPETLGRVFGALETCVIAASAVGALVMPLLLDAWSLPTALAVLGAPVGLLALVALPVMARLDARLVPPPALDLVRGLDIFAPLDPATLDLLARSVSERRFAAGEAIVTEGEESDEFYMVEFGRVRVTQGGRELRVEGPGDYFGEIGLLRDVARTATVTALDDTVLAVMARDDFLAAVTGHQESGRAAEVVVRRRLGG